MVQKLLAISRKNGRFARGEIPLSDHFDGVRFFNPGGASDHSFRDFLKIAREIQNNPWPRWLEIPRFDKPAARVFGPELQVNVINHATVLIQHQGLNILTDPVYGERTSPVSFVGPRRVHRPGIDFQDLPTIDLILLSHNHYDHLDLETLKKIEQRDSPLTLTSLGNELFLRQKGLKNVQEFDWWECSKFRDLVFHFVPAQHFSSRGLHDRNLTLWGGFVIESQTEQIYFAGDTGYGSFFKDIGQKFPQISLSFLPIGAYEPRWFMKPVHMNPEDAVQAHLDLRSRRSIGIHFGCFKLTSEPREAPSFSLRKNCQERGISEDSFRVPEFGKTYRLT